MKLTIKITDAKTTIEADGTSMELITAALVGMTNLFEQLDGPEELYWGIVANFIKEEAYKRPEWHEV